MLSDLLRDSHEAGLTDEAARLRALAGMAALDSDARPVEARHSVRLRCSSRAARRKLTEKGNMPVGKTEDQDRNDLALDVVNTDHMIENAERTTSFLKSLSHPVRLVILCRLSEGEARVNQIENTLGIPQAQVSKQLARLRDEGLVRAERDGRSVVYSLADERARRIVHTLYEEFCEKK